MLTTPVSYINSIPLDPFGKGMFYGYADKECSNTNGEYYIFLAVGPDGYHDGGGTPYRVSNGLVSSGGIRRTRYLRGDEFHNISSGDSWE